MIKLIYHIVI